MNIVEASVRRNSPGVWCPYDLVLATENQKKPGQTYCILPTDHPMIYTKKHAWDESTAYFYTDGEYVSFFVGNPRDQRGYGGAMFRPLVEQPDMSIRMEEVRGPYSSNSSAMTSLGFAQSVSATFAGSLSGHITKHFAERILKEFNLPYHYEPLREYAKQDPFCFVLYPD